LVATSKREGREREGVDRGTSAVYEQYNQGTVKVHDKGVGSAGIPLESTH